MEKLNKLASITGNPVESLGLTLDDIEEDFDPKEYDARMMSLFSEEYYAAGEGEEEKPVFSDMEEEGKSCPLIWVHYNCPQNLYKQVYVVRLLQLGILKNTLILLY